MYAKMSIMEVIIGEVLKITLARVRKYDIQSVDILNTS
jgi:hypothetical protein